MMKVGLNKSKLIHSIHRGHQVPNWSCMEEDDFCMHGGRRKGMMCNKFAERLPAFFIELVKNVPWAVLEIA